MSIRLNGSTSGYVEIDAPATAGSNTLVLPTGNGTSGQYLQTNGSGALSWAGAGKILQVVQTVKTDTYAATATTTETDITGMSASITPSSTSSKILVQVTLNLVVGAAFSGQYIVLKRNSTNIFIGDAAGSRIQATMATSFDLSNDTYGPAIRSFSYLDSPSTTSSVTYKLSHADLSGAANAIYVNRALDNTDSNSYTRTASNIILMEVAA